MDFFKNTTLDLYLSTDEISIYRFDKAANGDLRYLSKKENISRVKIGEAYNLAWKNLQNEYSEKFSNSSIVRIFLLRGEINYLISRYRIVSSLVDTAISTTDNDIFKLALEEIEKWGFKINKESDLNSEMNKVLTSLKNSTNKIKRKKNELSEIDKEGVSKMTLAQQKSKLETGLGDGRIIDTKKTTVDEWHAYWEDLKAKTKPQKRNVK